MLTWSGEVEKWRRGQSLGPGSSVPLLGLGSSLLTPGLGFIGGANLPEFVKAEAQSLLFLFNDSWTFIYSINKS